MSHDHHQHNHDHFGKNLLWATLLNFIITIFQIVGGILSNSLALISDAIHNLGDALAVFIAYIANKISQKDPTYSKTFGYKRVEILAALLNALVLVVICVVLVYESIERIQEPKAIRADIMLFVATIGLLANVISVFVLKKDSGKNINVKAAYLHLLGDTFSSVAVIVVGVVIYYKNIIWLDPLITILISLYLLKHTYSIIKETVNILMQGKPANIDILEIKSFLESFEEISNIHHVHIWNLTDKETHFECHVEACKNYKLSELNELKKNLDKELKQKFNITHITLQFEFNACKSNGLISK
jgi:cobalt-zinc-cadmium efflux system protein